MKMYSKAFHSGYLYLEIDDHEIDTLHPAVFETLMIQERKPLQVCISSDRSRLVELLRQSGFELKRRCYEMDVAASWPFPCRHSRKASPRPAPAWLPMIHV